MAVLKTRRDLDDLPPEKYAIAGWNECVDNTIFNSVGRLLNRRRRRWKACHAMITYLNF